ncbi:AAA family ATPase [Actinoplanes sp. L3-i22]|uniref:sensor histidine kinase n=1 Tax=Actinoplanes sp. L3-i22 TaxID=2836373 RepID=UPI001C7836C1|nr:AAA family ATPase [Actinoplanes sp. L3-i22]BCY11916.1 serine/threonine protein kinase [Actinoplanes sp. L3-i22]
MGEELLYQSDRTQVTRRTPPGAPAVVGKRATGPGAVRRTEHERAVLERLAGIPGVPRLAPVQQRQTIVLFDDRGTPPLPGPMPVPDLVRVAHALAGTLASVHRAGVLHRDITPANILLRPDAPPLLIDYDLAITGPPEPDEGPVGTLGYLSPEQTGRTGLATDRRADLYGLGATLYALATGGPPFPATDQLELVRDTLVHTPAVPELPDRLAGIVMRLLEKDPDHRYQSAEGLAHDLARFRDDPDGAWAPGERDFPAVLSPPPVLVGRDREIRALAGSLTEAMTAGAPAVLVSGPPGIGKSALVHTLRPAITARGGWFVSGKYEQFRTGTDSGGIARMVRALGRLLLAEPESDLTEDRKRVLAALGPNIAVLAGVIPEMAAFLNVSTPPFPGDPLTAPDRLSATVAALLRAVAERRRLVVLIDDLQWATASSLRILDGVLAEGPIPGLLVVAAYRDEQVDAEHPLAPLAARWQRDGLVGRPLRLGGLSRAGLAALTATVLRLPHVLAAELADLIGAAGAGNPYATVELINALRAEGLLTPASAGWVWNPSDVRAFVARHRLPQLLAVRLAQQAPPTRYLLTALTCLGADVRPELLALATGTLPATLPARLSPAVADGLISLDTVVRFRHDLVLQAARELLPADEIEQLQLTMARRLAGHDEFTREAAEQYLAVTALIENDAERRSAAALLHRAGRHTTRLTNYLVAEELFAAADRILAPLPTAADRASRHALAVDRHAALYYLGRHAEADRIYRELSVRAHDAVELAGATAVQINSLTQRGECRAAIALGLDTLRRFGLEPPADLDADNLRAVGALRDWVAANGPAYPETETSDPRVQAIATILHRMLPPAFLIDPARHAWVVCQAHELWLRNGVCAPLTGTLGAAICVTVGLLDDYRTGYLLTRHAVATGRRHGYQAETAIAAYMHLLLAAHWFTPLEEIIEPARQARDDLLAAGDVQVAGLHWARMLSLLLETEDSLETCADETEAVLAYAGRTGNRYARLIALAHRQLIRLLRGRSGAPGSFAADDFDEETYLEEVAGYPPALATYHQQRALAALLGDDPAMLAAHSAAAMKHSGAIRGFYASALTRVTRCLSLAGSRSAELTDARNWLVRRAADAPHNLRPLLLLVDAEIARGRGDAVTAIRCFDDGLHAVDGRPWHHALLAERAARFHLAQGLTHTGHQLLTEARDTYRAWGADGPVARLETEHPFLRNTASSAPGSGADRIDLMAILRASRALSSQTSVSGLTAQVGDVLSAMTGATDVGLSLRSDAGEDDQPWSAVRYVRRTRQPLLVADATRDDRFAGDPYLAGLDVCSLLVLPIACNSTEDAVLVLANRRQRGVFSTGRLETVELIAGQLAVSLDNALLYDSLESEVRARTAELADRNRDLEAANQLKADLIGMLGHEINNPLGTILGYLDLVLDGDPLPPDAAGMVTRVQITTRRLVTIVDEVLALVSIDAGRLTAAPRPVRVADHIEAALGATGTTAADVSCPRDLTASAQPGHLDQILTNLISNAAKYGGGVSTIVARADGDDGPVTVEVSDRGPGVPPEFRNRLFDRFARADTTANKVAGTGLGLYIVRELARANGGDVRYRPAPVRGSAFIVTLPAVTMGAHPDMR